MCFRMIRFDYDCYIEVSHGSKLNNISFCSIVHVVLLVITYY